MTTTPAGWYADPDNALQLRYWDGTRWTEHRAPAQPPTAESVVGPKDAVTRATPMKDKVQIAHDLAMAYINNRYGAEVKGEFSVDTWDDKVTGSGKVETERLPDVNKIRMVSVGTGERHLLGLLEKKQWVESGYEVDSVFNEMIYDYYRAYSKFLSLLERR